MRNISQKACVVPLALALALAVSCKGAPGANTSGGAGAGGAADGGAENIVFVPGINGIIGIEWKLIEVRFSVVRAETAAARFSRLELAELGMEDAYTLCFDRERISGMAAPNRYFAPYEEGEGKALSIGVIGGTLMAALREPESLNEREYFGYLENTVAWDLIRNQLLLHTRDGQGGEAVLVFEAGS
jgi:heat shock protein HslJ